MVELDSNPLLSNKEARLFFEELCLTTRGTLLLPVYVGEEKPNVYEDFLENGVPVGLNWLLHKNRVRRLLHIEGNSLIGFFLERRRGEPDEVKEEKIRISDLENCRKVMKLSMEKGLIGLKAKEKAYKSGIGLLEL